MKTSASFAQDYGWVPGVGTRRRRIRPLMGVGGA